MFVNNESFRINILSNFTLKFYNIPLMEKRNEINGLVMRFTNMIDTAGNKQEPHISYRYSWKIYYIWFDSENRNGDIIVFRHLQTYIGYT
jgi:hypothetical protein